MPAPRVGGQLHASRPRQNPPPPTHMPGGSVDLGGSGLISKKILEGGRGGREPTTACMHIEWGCSSMPAGIGSHPHPPHTCLGALWSWGSVG